MQFHQSRHVPLVLLETDCNVQLLEVGPPIVMVFFICVLHCAVRGGLMPRVIARLAGVDRTGQSGSSAELYLPSCDWARLMGQTACQE